MDDQQKGAILILLKTDKMYGNYTNRYWFSYKDFLDPTDDFTDFACECLDGKLGYIALIENLLDIDGTAKVFVEVYGLEENNDEQCIIADTLIIFSKLPLEKVKQIFNEPEDIFPSDVGEETDFSQPVFLIGDDGKISTDIFPRRFASDRKENIFDDAQDDYFVYYCWWD